MNEQMKEWMHKWTKFNERMNEQKKNMNEWAKDEWLKIMNKWKDE